MSKCTWAHICCQAKPGKGTEAMLLVLSVGCSHIPEWVENRMVFLMQIVNFALELDSKLRCWKPEYSRAVLTHVGSQIFRYKESARRDLVLFWPRLCETGMAILENNHAWAYQADGGPLRSTNVEDILGLELLFRARTHGPQPIIIPRTLTETTFSKSNIRSLLSLQLEQQTHTILCQRQKSQSPTSHLHIQAKSAFSTVQVFHLISSAFKLMSTSFSTT